MAWETVTAKNAAGDSFSIEGLASDVYLSDGRTASDALTSIASQASVLSSNQTALTTAVIRLRSQAGLTEGLNTLNENVATLSASVDALAEILGV